MGCQAAPVIFGQAGSGQLVGNPIVIRRIHDDGHRREVFGGGPQHRGAADVYVLQRVFQWSRRARLTVATKGYRFTRHQVNGFYAVSGQFGHLLGGVAAGQQPPVDHRVQRLDPAV